MKETGILVFTKEDVLKHKLKDGEVLKPSQGWRYYTHE